MAGRLSRRKLLIGVAIIASVIAVTATGFFLIDQTGRITPTSSSALTKAACELDELPLPEGAEGPVEVTAISDSGEYIAGTAGDKVIRWQNREPEVLEFESVELGDDREVLEDLDESEVSGVSSAGTVVGHSGWTLWVYRDEAMARLLPDPDDDDAAASLNLPPAINDKEVIVAAMTIEAADEKAIGRSQLWKPGEDQAVSFPFDGGVRDINSDGVVVGATSAEGASGSPRMWDVGKGVGEDMSRPADYDDATADHAANGWAAAREGLLWDLDAPTRDPREVALDTVADVDAQGTVYGELNTVPALEKQNGERQLLPLPKEDSAKTKILSASADGSTIVGYSGIGATSQARVWSCRQ